jgi:hypothetical protein
LLAAQGAAMRQVRRRNRPPREISDGPRGVVERPPDEIIARTAQNALASVIGADNDACRVEPDERYRRGRERALVGCRLLVWKSRQRACPENMGRI